MFRKRQFMEWQEYEAFINQVDELFWRNTVRERGLA